MMENIHYELTSAAKKHAAFCHYTCLSSLTKIVTNRALLINRLDKVNDLFENKYLENFWKGKIFIACFTHRESESFMYWTLYAMRNNDPGVMITFPKQLLDENKVFSDPQCCEYYFPNVKQTDLAHKEYYNPSDWGIFDITWADVMYTDDFAKYEDTHPIWDDLKDCVNLCKKDFRVTSGNGLLKGIAWDVENETRIRIGVRPKGFENYFKGVASGVVRPQFDRLFLRLSDNILESCTITLNPWADMALEDHVQKLLNNNKLAPVQIRRSTLAGTVKAYESWLVR